MLPLCLDLEPTPDNLLMSAWPPALVAGVIWELREARGASAEPPSDPEAPPSQPWKCAQPQPDGSCVKGAPTQAQWEFAQKSPTNVQGPPCKDCPSE